MCRALHVSTSGYYDWLDRPPSPRAERHIRIQQAVAQVHVQSHAIYGSHNIARQAIESRRRDGAQLLHHGDRGCQYTSDAYQQTLRTLGIDCSMSRTGCCYDNAVAERFFWSLKHEWTNHQHFHHLEHTRLSVFKYIETFYNPLRIHQTLAYLSPNQYEAVHAPAQAA